MLIIFRPMWIPARSISINIDYSDALHRCYEDVNGAPPGKKIRMSCRFSNMPIMKNKIIGKFPASRNLGGL
ncbi:MAG: hypothetical protein ACLURV_14295 [Gallintestinimicrobium sp.]